MFASREIHTTECCPFVGLLSKLLVSPVINFRPNNDSAWLGVWLARQRQRATGQHRVIVTKKVIKESEACHVPMLCSHTCNVDLCHVLFSVLTERANVPTNDVGGREVGLGK